MRAAVLLSSIAAASAQAWGPTGHRAVGQIAERHLTPSTLAETAVLLDGAGLAQVSTWADEIRSDPAWHHADPWHYINLDDGQDIATAPRNPAGDILEAIDRFSAILADRSAPRGERGEALRFLVHLVGDVHQPLHAGRADDRGGNTVVVRWFGRPSKLHRVWDSDLIDGEQSNFSEWARFLDRAAPETVRPIQASGPLDWARESYELRAACYAIGDGELGYEYARLHLPTVRDRLLRAGLRLAALLERLLGAGGG